MIPGKTKISADLPSRAEGPAFLFSSASITSSGKPKPQNQKWAADDGLDGKRYTGIFSNYIYISIVVEQTAERKHQIVQSFHNRQD